VFFLNYLKEVVWFVLVKTLMHMILTTRYWGITTVLLCALLFQNCQLNSAKATEEEEPAAGVSPASAMRQRASSEHLVMRSLIPLNYSPVVPGLPSWSPTTSASEKAFSAAPFSYPLSPLALSPLAATVNSPAAPYDLPAAEMPGVSRAVPLGNKSDHVLPSEDSHVYLGKMEGTLRGTSSDVEEDSKPPAKRRSSDLEDELAERNERVRDGERRERGCVHRDTLSALLDVAESEPGKDAQCLEVLHPGARNDHFRQQALEALGKVAKASPAVFSECPPSLLATAETRGKDARLLAIKTLGEVKWKHYFGDVGPVPDLPRDMAAILDGACPIWPSRKVRDTHLLVLIPATVGGAPLTLNLLGVLVQRLKNGGYGTKYRHYSNAVRAQFGNNSSGRSYWLLMTRDVLEGSRSRKYSAQKALVARYTGDDGRPYEMPSALEAATAILMHHVRTGERLFGDDPWTYTRCQELVDDRYPVVVGGFASSGLRVDGNYYGSIRSDGVAGCRKF
jgi:hypothetical protein